MKGWRATRVARSIAVAFCLLAHGVEAQTQAPCAPATAGQAGGAPAVAPGPESESAGALAGRLVTETLLGSGLATIGFLVGPEVTAAACRTCVYAAGLAGANALFPLGVYWGGNSVGGEGSFLFTVAGPWLVSATAFTAIALDQDYDGKPAFKISAIGGAIAAPLSIALYEVTHARRRAEKLRRATAFRPLVAFGPQRGGLSLQVAGQF